MPVLAAPSSSHVVQAFSVGSGGGEGTPRTGAALSASLRQREKIHLPSGHRHAPQTATREMKKDRNHIVASVSSVDAAEAAASAAWIARARREEDPSQTFKVINSEDLSRPDWNPAEVLEIKDLAPGVRCITVWAEVGREIIPLDKAYRKPGQQVAVRTGGALEVKVLPSSPPPHPNANEPVLLKLRGDIPAGTTKVSQYTVSVKDKMDLHVVEAEAPELFNAAVGDVIELGHFDNAGLDLRPITFLAGFPTILIFARGKSIAPARAIVEAALYQPGSLQLDLRADARLFYSAPTPAALAYKDKFTAWESNVLKVRPTVDSVPEGEDWSGHIGTFSQLFEADDLEYDPSKTGVVVLGNREVIDEVVALAEELEIPSKNVLKLEL